MSTKNSKTKTATKAETQKQTAGAEKVEAVPTANTIVEKKMEDKVVAVEKKADKKTDKKGGAKEATAPVATPAKVEAKTEVKTEKKTKGGAKEATPTPAPVVAAPAKVEAKAEKKAEKKVKGGAKEAVATPVAAPVKVEAKTEKKAEAKTEKKAKGGAKKEAKVEAKKEEVKAAADDDEEGEVTGTKLRYFKLIYNEKDQGRYCGKKPKQAANKAFSSIIKELKKTGQQNGGVNVDINFSIRECTRNSKHKEYKYIGKRQVLTNPVKVVIENKDSEGKKIGTKEIEYKFHNKLQKAPKA